MYLFSAWTYTKKATIKVSQRASICNSSEVSNLNSVLSRKLDSTSDSHSRDLGTPASSSPMFSSSHVYQKTTDFKDNEGDKLNRSTGKFLRGSNGHALYIGPSPVASFLSQASNNTGTSKDTFPDPMLQSNAEESLTELSDTFAAIDFQDAADVRRNVRNFRRIREIFFIPGKEEGLQLIERQFQSSSFPNPSWGISLTCYSVCEGDRKRRTLLHLTTERAAAKTRLRALQCRESRLATSLQCISLDSNCVNETSRHETHKRFPMEYMDAPRRC